ncbi:MAG: HD domain-containing protein [Ruegeria sp.]
MATLAELQGQLRRIAGDRMASDPAHDLAHLDRVWINAKSIADTRTNMRVLLAACYLHDLVNVPKNAPDRHLASQHSAEKAAPILANLDYTPVEIQATQHAIAAHSFSANITPETPEACVLRDADRLDALGAVGIARTFSVAGSLGRALYDPTDPFAVHRPLNDLQFSVDHWKVKLLKLPSDMLTEGGRSIARERANRMIRYLDDFAGEIGANLPADWASIVDR